MNGHIKSIVSAGIRFSLILLWVYASMNKLLNYEQSRMQMMNQVFPAKLSWGQHLIFNLVFLALALLGLFILIKEEPMGKEE